LTHHARQPTYDKIGDLVLQLLVISLLDAEHAFLFKGARCLPPHRFDEL
jgi:hypothetical protein